MKEKTITILQERFPNLSIQGITLPANQSLNAIWTTEGEEPILALLSEVSEISSAEPLKRVERLNTGKKSHENLPLTIPTPTIPVPIPKQEIGSLEKVAEQKRVYVGKLGQYIILGHLPQDWRKMGVQVQFLAANGERFSKFIDLFSPDEISQWLEEIEEKSINPNLFKADLDDLADKLQAQREQESLNENSLPEKSRNPILSPSERKKAEEILMDKKLLFRLDGLIEKAGIIGEEAIRLTTFIAASTALNGTKDKLHIILQGTSGSGKSHVLNTIGKCFLPEKILDATRITPANLFHASDESLMDVLILLQDYDGLEKKAEYAFRELISNNLLTTQGVMQDRNKKNIAYTKQVRSNFASLAATTNGNIYPDNESRSILLGVDESEQQSRRVIERQNLEAAGKIDFEGEQQAQTELQNILRLLQPCQVVNLYATEVFISVETKSIRRLNKQFQTYVKQITWLYQFQREKDEQGRLITTKEDVRMAVETFIAAILLKVDDLGSQLRQFFERLKTYMQDKGKNDSVPEKLKTVFTKQEIRKAFKLSHSSTDRLINQLLQMEYLQETGGNKKQGILYQIFVIDEIEQEKNRIKELLLSKFPNP